MPLVITKFRGLMVTMKTTKIGFQQIKTNFQYKACDTNTRSQVTRISNTIGMDLGNLHLNIRVILMVVSTTFNNISAISWRSILLVDETGGPRENHRPAANNWQTLSHNVVSEYISSWAGFELITLVVLAFEPPDHWYTNVINTMIYKARGRYLFKTKILRYPRIGGLLFSMLATSV